jgi:hypothetical protein
VNLPEILADTQTRGAEVEKKLGGPVERDSPEIKGLLFENPVIN